MTRIGIVNLNGCSYEMDYDLISQDTVTNKSVVRLYGILNVTNNYVAWDNGSASVHTSGMQPIGTYYSKGSHTLITRDFDFYHDSKGEFSQWIGGSLSTTLPGGSGNVAGVMTLPTIKRFAIITSVPNTLNDEQNPYFEFNNAGNANDLTAWLELVPSLQHYATRNLTITSGTYTWELTEEERNQIRSQMPISNNSTIRIVLYSKQGTEGYTSFKDIPFSIINANPEFDNFDFEDTNTTTVALTGSTKNNVINVNGYSNIQATITTNDKAQAIKEASMVKYRFSINNSSTDIIYSDENDVSGTINNSIDGIYNLYAIDSRNNSTLVTKQATNIINYENITLDKQNCSFVRDNNQVGQNAILTINGTFWNDNFGQVINSIKSVSYKFKKSDSSTWINGTTTITPTISGNTFTFTGMIASDNLDTTWDLDSSYNLEVIISDELSSATINTLILNSAVPTMSLDKNGVGIMCAYDSSLGGKLQVDGKIIDEDIYSTNEIKTNKIWTDNKPIYRKIIDIGQLPNSTSKSILHNISISTPISCIGIVSRSSGVINSWTIPTIDIAIDLDINQIYVVTTSDRSDLTGVAIIEYTKTTD